MVFIPTLSYGNQGWKASWEMCVKTRLTRSVLQRFARQRVVDSISMFPKLGSLLLY
jgi:hypothetical protein